MTRVLVVWAAFPLAVALVLHLAHRGWIGPRALLIEQRDDALQAVMEKDLDLYLCEQRMKRKQSLINDLHRRLSASEARRQAAETPLGDQIEQWLSSQREDS